MKKLIIILLPVLFISCATPIEVNKQYVSTDFDFSALKGSKISIYGTDKINLNDFAEDFNNVYGDNEKLYDFLSLSVGTLFGKYVKGTRLYKAGSVLPDSIDIKQLDNYDEKMNVLFDKLPSDYLFLISQIDVDKKILEGRAFSIH